MMHSILLVIDERTRDALGDRLAALSERVMVVLAGDPDHTMNTIKEYIALTQVIAKLVRHGIVIEDGADFELSQEFAQRLSGEDRHRVMSALLEFNDAMGLSDDELVRATVFIEGFLKEEDRADG